MWKPAALLLALTATPAAAQAPADQLLAAYVAAWDRADARALAGFFARDGELQTPYGFTARGRDEIAAFYAAAFQRGYAGSRGGAQLTGLKPIAPGATFVRGRWSIRGAVAQGSPRPPECGDFFLVLRREPARGRWSILALHELAGTCPKDAG